MLKLESFVGWCNRDSTTNGRILACYGIPGAGKTFIRYLAFIYVAMIQKIIIYYMWYWYYYLHAKSSLVIDHLENEFPGQPIACLYSDYRDQKNQTVLNILGTFIYQFLRSSPNLLQIRDDIILTLKDVRGKKEAIGCCIYCWNAKSNSRKTLQVFHMYSPTPTPTCRTELLGRTQEP